MPAPNPRSRLIRRLTAATGLSTVWCYRLLAAGREPLDPAVQSRWRQVIADQPAGDASEIQADDSGACPHGMPPLGAGVHPVGAR